VIRTHVAVVERALTQNVIRGENRGRKLSHDNVVRVFDSRNDLEDNLFELMLPEDLDVSKSSLVVYKQHQTTWQIKGAKKIDLSGLN